MAEIQIRVKKFFEVLVKAEVEYLRDQSRWDRRRHIQDGLPCVHPLLLLAHLGETVRVDGHDCVVPSQQDVFWALKRERDRLISHTTTSSVMIEAVNRLLDFVQHHGQSAA